MLKKGNPIRFLKFIPIILIVTGCRPANTLHPVNLDDTYLSMLSTVVNELNEHTHKIWLIGDDGVNIESVESPCGNKTYGGCARFGGPIQLKRGYKSEMLKRLMLHEIGHAYGLSHNKKDVCDIMFITVSLCKKMNYNSFYRKLNTIL